MVIILHSSENKPGTKQYRRRDFNKDINIVSRRQTMSQLVALRSMYLCTFVSTMGNKKEKEKPVIKLWWLELNMYCNNRALLSWRSLLLKCLGKIFYWNSCVMWTWNKYYDLRVPFVVYTVYIRSSIVLVIISKPSL